MFGAVAGGAAAAEAPAAKAGSKRKGEEDIGSDSKLLEAVAALALQHESERRSTARDQNVVFKMKKESKVAASMEKGSDEYSKDGKAAREAAESEGKEYKGNPNGKKPDALLRMLLWKVAEEITEDVVAKARTAVQADPTQEAAATRALEVLQRVRQLGLAQKDNLALRATRCFSVVPAGDATVVKWIWAAQGVPELTAMARELRETKALRLVDIEVEEDEAPQSRAAKEVQKQLDSRKGAGKGDKQRRR